MPAPRYSIVGENWVNAGPLLKSLKGGEKLRLVREPGNPADKKAVAVYLITDVDAVKLGFVPKANNETLSRFIDENGAGLAQDGALAQPSIDAIFVRSANSGFPQAEVVDISPPAA